LKNESLTTKSKQPGQQAQARSRQKSFVKAKGMLNIKQQQYNEQLSLPRIDESTVAKRANLTLDEARPGAL
jgi:hypothetical protein